MRGPIIALACLGLLATSWSLSMAMSIERELVPVTNRNVGPKYDIEAEKTKLDQTSDDNNNNNYNRNNNQDRSLDGGSMDSTPAGPLIPIGRMSIRRIYLMPVNPWALNHEQQDHREPQPGREQPSSSSNEAEHPFVSRPFWPFMTPIRAPSADRHHLHLFGSDEASRSPSGEREGSRDSMQPSGSSNNNNDNEPPTQAAVRPIFDPIQMMIDMMHQTLQSELEHPSQEKPSPNFHDLAKEADSLPRPDLETRPARGESAELAPTGQPMSKIEKEDIVEIDGSKYLRKTIINRRADKGIVFMTKRLIFTPLNETDSMTPTTEKTTTEGVRDDRAQEMPVRPTSEPTTTTTITTNSVESTMAPASSDQPSTFSTIVTNDEKSNGAPSEPTTTTTTPTREMMKIIDTFAAIEDAGKSIIENAKAKLDSTTTTANPATATATAAAATTTTTTTTTTTPSPAASV